MQQYLYVVRPVRPAMLTDGPTAAEREAVSRHAAYLAKLTEEGQVLLVGRTQTTDPDTMGLAIFRAQTPEAARRMLEEDPAVVAGVFRGQVYPYRVGLLARADQQAPWTPQDE